jgi:tetratricopeptide (TPR) repeat protein
MALIRLAWVIGELGGDADEATTLLSLADGKLDRLGLVPELSAELEQMRGHLARGQDPAEALLHYRSALEHRRTAYGPGDRRVAESLINVGIALDETNQPVEARESFEQAQALLEPVVGSVHPLLASASYAIGVTYIKRGQADRAVVFLQEAFDQSVASEGRDAISTHRYAAVLGAALLELDRFAAGHELMHEARRRLADLAGPHDIDVFRTRINLARAYLDRDEVERARRELIDDLGEYEARFADQPVLGDAWVVAASIHLVAGDEVRSADAAKRAAALRRRLRQSPALAAEAEVLLGQALEHRDPERAVELVRAAHAVLAQDGESPSLATAAAWLDARVTTP